MSPPKVTAVVGTYRRGGVCERTVDAMLAAMRERGVETEKVLLLQEPIEFCRNCRACTQAPGAARGRCVLQDGMSPLLDKLEASQGIVLASPMNFGSVTALMKRFIERLVCYSYWPFGAPAPVPRSKAKPRRALLVATAACPSLMGRFLTGMVGLMKAAAGILGARTDGVLFIGLSGTQRPGLKPRTLRRARAMGAAFAERLKEGR
jgi:putative NADPH-quinone reductase